MISTFIAGVLVFLILFIFLSKVKGNGTNSFLKQFKKKWNKSNRLKKNAKDGISNYLMSNPENDIKITSIDSESELREKADIHRARLRKYGKSKMNGFVLYLGPKGGVYKFSTTGKKVYI